MPLYYVSLPLIATILPGLTRIAHATRRRRVQSPAPRFTRALGAFHARLERFDGPRYGIHCSPPRSNPAITSTADSRRPAPGIGCNRDPVRRAARAPVGDRAHKARRRARAR